MEGNGLKYDHAPAYALLAAKVILLNNNLSLSLDWEDLYCRFSLLRDRYATFKWVLAYEGSDWDRENNCVFTSDDKWNAMFMEKPMAKAYYSRVEPLYDDMMILFALDNVKNEELSHKVINLDESEASDDVSVEVTSPPLNSRCRRLFEGPSNPPSFPAMNFGPRKPRYMESKKKSSGQGQSSTLSTSPLMWWKP